MSGNPDYIYKLVPQSVWVAADAAGVFLGSEVDRRDGFIHLSTQEQVAETGRRHFAGVPDLLLVELHAAAVVDGLRWEPSRGGALFPHLYGSLLTHLARKVVLLERDALGELIVPPLPLSGVCEEADRMR